MAESHTSDKDRKDPNAQLTKLQNLIVGPTTERLEGVEQQIGSLDHQARVVSQVLPKSITMAAAKNNRLAAALGPILEKTIQRSIIKDRRILADALFPVIGPAIRKAITSAIQGMVDNFNHVLNQSFSFKSLRWRLEAIRTRRPLAEIVLLNTLIYQVEQVFLIQPDTGLLIEHVFAKTAVPREPDLVSGMLTAIKDFVQDSFGSDQEDTVENFQVGERKIWIEHGKLAILALAIRGNPPTSLKNMMRDALDEIHLTYTDELSILDGDFEALKKCRPILNGLLQAQFKKGRSRSSLLPWLILTVVLGLIGWWGFMQIVDSRRLAGFVDRLRNQPGIVVTQVKKQDGQLHIWGMKDPYAPGTSTAMEASGISENEVEFNWETYQSAHPEFALRRIVSLFEPPATVTMTFDQGALQFSGAALRQWIADARRLVHVVPWIEHYDDRQLVDINTRLNAPPSVSFILQGKNLRAFGSAPRIWIESARAAAKDLSVLDSYDDTQLIETEDQAWKTFIQTINQSIFYFEAEGSTLVKGQERDLQTFVKAVEQIIALSRLLNHPIHIDIFGHSDDTNGETVNLAVSRQRAQIFADLLIGLGMAPSFVSVHALGSSVPVSPPQDGTRRDQNRRVIFKVSKFSPPKPTHP